MTIHPYLKLLPLFRDHKFFCFFTLAIFLASCTARFPVSSIYSSNQSNDSIVQWPEIKDESSTQIVKMRPLENIHEMLLFELEVTNKSQDSIPITPKNWRLEYFSNFTALDSPTADTVSYPLNGAQVNQGYQKVADKIKAAKDGTTILIIMGIAVVVIALIVIASSSNKSKDKKSDRNASYDTFANVGLNMSFGFHNRSFEHPRTDDWSEKEKIAYFRQRGQELKTMDNSQHMIPPGETYLYGLFFPRKATAKHLILKGTIGQESYTWDFDHDGLNLPKKKI